MTVSSSYYPFLITNRSLPSQYDTFRPTDSDTVNMTGNNYILGGVGALDTLQVTGNGSDVCCACGKHFGVPSLRFPAIFPR